MASPSVVNRESHKEVAHPLAGEQHGIASRYFGHIPPSDRPLRQVPREEAQQAFVRGMLDTPTEHGHRNPIDWAVSLGVHVLLVAAAVVVPLFFTQVLDLHNFAVTYLALPRPPAAAPAPAPVVQRVSRPVHAIVPSKLTAPIAIPRKVEVVQDEGLPDIAAGGVIGGVPGGESGGILGGVIGGTGSGPAAPKAVTKPEKQAVLLRVGGDVKPPRQVLRIEPKYPSIARQSRIEGMVLIEAVIDEHGNVVQAHVVTGPGLLVPSALAAVLQWKYEPTYLNGVPVSISMSVQVMYSLSS
jgi:protein TonB